MSSSRSHPRTEPGLGADTRGRCSGLARAVTCKQVPASNTEGAQGRERLVQLRRRFFTCTDIKS